MPESNLRPPPREPSDRWDLEAGAPVVERDSFIPGIARVPETPEERRRRRIVRAAVAAFVAVCVVASVLIVLHLRHLAEVREAVLVAGADGRAVSIERALALLDEGGSTAERTLSARLLATAALELGRDESSRAKAVLESLSDKDASLLDARIARVYLALAGGEPREAAKEASDIVPAGIYAAEAVRARALAALAVGNREGAEKEARLALEQQPGSPRHTALLATILAVTGAIDAALNEAPGSSGDPGPALRVARGRALAMRDPAAARAEADAVLADTSATEVEKAWAHLLRAQEGLRGPARAEARAAAHAAAEGAPPGDELFALGLAQVRIRLGMVEEAKELFDGLPEDTSTDSARRAQVGAELALSLGDLDGAAEQLEKATTEPFTDFLRAQWRQGRGEYDEAAKLYREAAAGALVRVAAFTSLAAMELERERAGSALEAAEKALEAAPTDPGALAMATRAHIGLEQVDEAMKVVLRGLAAHPEDGRLLAARAGVEMALEKWDAALETLRAALEKDPDDPDLHATRGDAARRIGKADDAKSAYQSALERASRHPGALVGLLSLAVDAEDVEEARGVLERIDDAKLVSIDVDRLRARFHVLAGDGNVAIPEVRRAIVRRGPQDPVLWHQLGFLHLQAERPNMALSSFQRVQQAAEDDPASLVGKALAQIALRRLRPADRTISDAELIVRQTSPGAEVEALLAVAKGRLELVQDRQGPARAYAKRALQLDARSSEAHLLLADIVEAAKKDPTPHLRAALKARRPSREAGIRLATRELEEGEERPEDRCELAAAYREAAPQGRFAKEAARIVNTCRR